MLLRIARGNKQARRHTRTQSIASKCVQQQADLQLLQLLVLRQCCMLTAHIVALVLHLNERHPLYTTYDTSSTDHGRQPQCLPGTASTYIALSKYCYTITTKQPAIAVSNSSATLLTFQSMGLTKSKQTTELVKI